MTETPAVQPSKPQAAPYRGTEAELVEAKRRCVAAIQAAATRADLLRYRASYLRRGFAPADAVGGGSGQQSAAPAAAAGPVY